MTGRGVPPAPPASLRVAGSPTSGGSVLAGAFSVLKTHVSHGGPAAPLLASHSQCGLFLGAGGHLLPALPASPALPVLSPNRRRGGPRRSRVVRAPSTPSHTPGSPQSACHLPAIPPARPPRAQLPSCSLPLACLLPPPPGAQERLPPGSASDRLRGLGWSPGPEARGGPLQAGLPACGLPSQHRELAWPLLVEEHLPSRAAVLAQHLFFSAVYLLEHRAAVSSSPSLS